MVRHKNRYIVVEINEVGQNGVELLKLKGPSFYEAIMNRVQTLHGDFGIAAIRAGFTAKYFNEYTRIAVIRCRHGPHKLVTSIIPLIRLVEKKNVIVNILYVGATIKQCFIFLKNYQQRKFDEYCVTLKSDSEKEKLKQCLLNFEEISTKL